MLLNLAYALDLGTTAGDRLMAFLSDHEVYDWQSLHSVFAD